MPRTAPTDQTIEYARPDGSILRARLERREGGVWAVDLRPFGGGRPTLKPAGSRAGTKDETEARQLALAELRAIAGGMVAGTQAAVSGPVKQVELYLQRRVALRKMTEATAASAYHSIVTCWDILQQRYGVLKWSQVQRQHIGDLVAALGQHTYRGKALAPNTVLRYLNYTKGFLSWALDEGIVQASPIHRHKEIPSRDTSYKRPWLEAWQVGALLEASFAGRDEYKHNACRAWPEILATGAYTGARETEVLGLAMSELKFTGGERGFGTLRFQHNRWRRLKNDKSERVFSLWPAHAAILKAYVAREKPPEDGLLFPGPDGHMWKELRHAMDRDIEAAKITTAITDHGLRHSYVSCRSRMYKEIVRGGQIVVVPVHLKDIIREVGHASERMAREVYDHDSLDPVEGWTDLDYAAALRERRKGLARPAAGRTASKRARRSASKRSA